MCTVWKHSKTDEWEIVHDCLYLSQLNSYTLLSALLAVPRNRAWSKVAHYLGDMRHHLKLVDWKRGHGSFELMMSVSHKPPLSYTHTQTNIQSHIPLSAPFTLLDRLPTFWQHLTLCQCLTALWKVILKCYRWWTEVWFYDSRSLVFVSSYQSVCVCTIFTPVKLDCRNPVDSYGSYTILP